MEYSEKYYHEYCDRHGNTYRISLRELGYTDESIKVECGNNPWMVEQESSSDLKVGGVYPSRAKSIFISDGNFNLQELYTGQENTYQLARLKNGVVDWIGFVIPDGFRERDYDQQKPILEVYASDNLPALKGMQFVDQSGDNYGNSDTHIKSFLWVISEALKKTGSLLPIWTMVDIKTLFNGNNSVYNLPVAGVSAETSELSSAYLRFEMGTDISAANTMISRLIEAGKVTVDSPSLTGLLTVSDAQMEFWLPGGNPYVVRAFVSEAVPDFDFEDGHVEIPEPETGLVLSRRGHFNDVAPSEIGIFQEGVDFSFLKIGDTVKISQSLAGNNGAYTVTGFVSSPPPSSEYIRIQLSPQVPVQLHENVIVEIISTQTDFPDPLLTNHDVRVWIRDSNVEGKTYYEARGGAMTTWDVLDAIARQFNVKIQQNQGHWEVKRWNADKIDSGTYQWYIYNSEGTQIARQSFGDDVLMPCLPTQQRHRLYGTTRQMDRVLKNVIVNYRYKFKQDGDSLNNLVVNGNFEGSFNPYPRGWNMVKVDSYITIPGMTISKVTSDLPTGFTDALRIENYADTRTMNNLTVLSNTSVNEGDMIKIQWWEKRNAPSPSSSVGVYSIAIYESLNHAYSTSQPGGGGGPGRDGVFYSKVFHAVNSGKEMSRGQDDVFRAKWLDSMESGSRTHHRFVTGSDRSNMWLKVTVTIEEVPINGYLKFEVLGVATNRYTPLAGGGETLSNPERVSPAPAFVVDPNRTRDSTDISYVDSYKTWFPPSQHASLEVTGIFIGKLVNPNNEAVPQIDPFMYPDEQAQRLRKFTDTINEIEVLTGDDYGQYTEDRISGMFWGGDRTTMWDTWDNRYGWSRQGLVTAKSVMEMYWTPTRLLEVDIQAPNIHWSTRFQFEEMPGLRFAILRGSINSYHDNFRGTLTEVHNNATAPLPPGGNDGGNTVEANWKETGVTRCVRDEDTGLYTGNVESVEKDINTASPTFGQERWVLSGNDTDSCPIGEPIDLYWGASFLPIDPDLLNTFPYQKDSNKYTVEFSNDDSGRHLTFIHRASLGIVTSIRYVIGGYEAHSETSSWQYLADTTINGVTYKVMRQWYPTGSFHGLGLTFTIS